jgi:hypothetical protein
MALFDESRRHSRVPSGKYRGWSVNQVPEEYLFWVNTEGRTTSLYKWLHKKARGGKPPAQQVREIKNRAKRRRGYHKHFMDHIGHQSQVLKQKNGQRVVFCLECQKVIHYLTRDEYSNFKENTNETTR